MSGEKDLRAPRSVPGRGQATRIQLQLERGRLDDRGDVIYRLSMGKKETWRRVSGHGGKAVFEKEKSEG